MIRLIAAMLLGGTAPLTLSGCVSTNVAGSEVGGTVPIAGLTRQQALDAARAHCGGYGRSARILAVRRLEDGSTNAIFECRPEIRPEAKP